MNIKKIIISCLIITLCVISCCVIDKPNDKKETKTIDGGRIINHLEYQGEYNVTYYCACMKCCGKTNGITASGTHAKQGRTIATSDEFEFGTKLLVEFADGSNETFTVEDRGGAIQDNRLDIYMNKHGDCLKKGRRVVNVYVIKTDYVLI